MLIDLRIDYIAINTRTTVLMTRDNRRGGFITTCLNPQNFDGF
jgi:hypothetical protein